MAVVVANVELVGMVNNNVLATLVALDYADRSAVRNSSMDQHNLDMALPEHGTMIPLVVDGILDGRHDVDTMVVLHILLLILA